MNAQSPAPPLVRLGDITTLNPAAPVLDPAEQVAFVPMSAVSEVGTMRVAEHVAAADLKPGYSYMQSGDVVVAKITPCYENNKIAVATLDRPHGFGSTEFHVVRTDPNALDARYLVHFLRQERVRRDGERRMTGSAGQRRVPRQFIEELAIPLPALAEQRRIAAVLDQADELRRLRREGLELLSSLAEVVFERLFGDVERNDRGWHRSPLNSVVRGFEGGKNIVAEGDDSSNPVRVLKISAIQEQGFVAAETKALPDGYEPPGHHFVRASDLLLSRANTTERVGMVALVESTPEQVVLPDKILRFMWRHADACPRFWLYAFRSRPVRQLIGRLATGTSGSMKNISQEKLMAVELGIPPLPLQQAFAARVAEIDALKARHRAHLARLDALFASLQHRAFRGEL